MILTDTLTPVNDHFSVALRQDAYTDPSWISYAVGEAIILDFASTIMENIVNVFSLLSPKDEMEAYGILSSINTGGTSPTVTATWIQQSMTRYVPAMCLNVRHGTPDVWAGCAQDNGNPDKGRIRLEATASPPGTSRRTMSLIIAD